MLLNKIKNNKKSILLDDKGFTMIEIIVGILLMSITLGVASTLFIDAIGVLHQKVETDVNEVEHAATTDVIKSQVANATDIVFVPVADVTAQKKYEELNYKSLTIVDDKLHLNGIKVTDAVVEMTVEITKDLKMAEVTSTYIKENTEKELITLANYVWLDDKNNIDTSKLYNLSEYIMYLTNDLVIEKEELSELDAIVKRWLTFIEQKVFEHATKSPDRGEIITAVFQHEGNTFPTVEEATIAGLKNYYWRPYYLKQGSNSDYTISVVLYGAPGNSATTNGWNARFMYIDGVTYYFTSNVNIAAMNKYTNPEQVLNWLKTSHGSKLYYFDNDGNLTKVEI